MVAVDAVRDFHAIPYRASRYDAGGSGSASDATSVGASTLRLTSSVGQFGVERTTHQRDVMAGSRAATQRYARHMITLIMINHSPSSNHNNG